MIEVKRHQVKVDFGNSLDGKTVLITTRGKHEKFNPRKPLALVIHRMVRYFLNYNTPPIHSFIDSSNKYLIAYMCQVLLYTYLLHTMKRPGFELGDGYRSGTMRKDGNATCRRH